MKGFGFLVPFRPSGRRLFVKIFWVFWLAMSVAGVVLLAIEAERAGRLEKRMQIINDAAIAFYAVSVAKDHEDEQTWQSRAFLKDLKARTNIEGWLFDENGHEVSAHDPAELRALQRQTTAIPKLREKAEATSETIFDRLNTVTLAAHTATAPSGRRYTFVGVLPQSRFGPWNALPWVQVMRLLAVLTTAGIVSWVLALHLTRPIATLREATHRLAEGDLSARATTEYQRDELGDLSRDFNVMAERLETSMREQNRLIDAQKRLLGDVAHELRSPLARINVALELARDASEVTSNGISRENADKTSLAIASAHDRIEREVGRLNDLISRLLTLSRLESGVQKRNDSTIDMLTLVENIVSDADYEARPSKRVVLSDYAMPQTGEPNISEWTVIGTPELLQSAIENVVRNAIRHTSENTTVEVSLRNERNDSPSAHRWLSDTDGCYVSPPSSSVIPPSFHWVVVGVRDYGPGVAPNELGEVFHPFYRAGKGRAMRDGGVGLGLAISLGAISLHKGQVRACNEDDGGLRIEMRLPLFIE